MLVLIVLVAFRKTFFRLAIAMYQESESMQESIRTKREIENSDIIGFGAGFWWTMVAFSFGILFLRIWGYENLLNGTNKVSPLIINISEVFFKNVVYIFYSIIISRFGFSLLSMHSFLFYF